MWKTQGGKKERHVSMWRDVSLCAEWVMVAKWREKWRLSKVKILEKEILKPIFQYLGSVFLYEGALKRTGNSYFSRKILRKKSKGNEQKQCRQVASDKWCVDHRMSENNCQTRTKKVDATFILRFRFEFSSVASHQRSNPERQITFKRPSREWWFYF